jgi:hypothetical protein
MDDPGSGWSRDVADDLARTRGTVRIRLGPGILRNFEIARSIAGFPFSAERTGEVEAALGEDGWFGPHGIERFLAAVRRLGLRHGLARTPHVDVHVTAGFLAFSMPGAVVPRGWPPAPEVGAHLAAAGLEFTADGSSGPKDAAATGGLVAAFEPLAGRRVFFIGAPRTRPFAAALGVAAEDHFVIPDRAAYALTDDIIAAARRFIALAPDRPPVLVHAASLVGNTVLLELAATETPFVGLDLGLAATIHDDEYLSTRAWFIDHGVGIIRTRDALAARTEPVPRDPAEIRHARAVAFGRGWRAATKQWRTDPQAALDGLESALADTEGLRVPIARATSLLWRHRLGRPLPADWETRLLAERVKHEAATIAALMLWSSGRLPEAREALDRAASLCPADELVGRLRPQLVASNAPCADTSLLDGLVTLAERPYLGSALSWSLSGDLPRRWPDA